MARCGMCFKDKELVRPTPKSKNVVCKACWYEIDRVVGYMESLGMGFQHQLENPETPVEGELDAGKPPKPPSKPGNAKERARQARDTGNGSNPP